MSLLGNFSTCNSSRQVAVPFYGALLSHESEKKEKNYQDLNLSLRLLPACTAGVSIITSVPALGSEMKAWHAPVKSTKVQYDILKSDFGTWSAYKSHRNFPNSNQALKSLDARSAFVSWVRFLRTTSLVSAMSVISPSLLFVFFLNV